VNTFLPIADFRLSAACLDSKRLFKQVVECDQMIDVLRELDVYRGNPQLVALVGWRNHPAVVMWKGFLPSLIAYRNAMLFETLRRGFKTSKTYIDCRAFPFPPWFGDESVHRSHRSNLLRKDASWYSAFNWGVSPDLPYVWPT
jgi:hypothetical protein